VRLELVEFLLASDQKAAARAELIGVAANLPPDPEMRTQVGVLLMNAGGYDDALRLFREALAAKPRSTVALAGVGECYFRSGQYAQAEPYLDQALRRDPKLTQVGTMRDTARAVMDLDPFIRWLSEQERAQRASQAFDQAITRLQSCAAQRGIDLRAADGDPLQSLFTQATPIQSDMRRRTLRRDSEWVSNTMDVVFDIEKAASQACGEPQGLDLALLLIAREQEGARP
jgi:tetratricopeptide (TPR) repeat protein